MAQEEEPLPEAAEPEGSAPGAQDGIRSFNIAYARDGELDTLPTMKLVDERTAALFGLELGHAFQSQIDVTVDRVDIRRASEFADDLEIPGCYSLLELEALGGHGMLSMQQELFFKLLELLFGATPQTQQFGSSARKRFSSVEERVIRRIVHLFGRSMEAAWRPVIPMHVVHLRIETKPENAPISDRDDWLVVTSYQVKLGGDFVGQMRVALPKAGLMKYRERLSSGRYEKRPEHKESWKSALVEAVRRVDVEVVAELGRSQITLYDLLSIQEGQVLRLDSAPEHPLIVRVADTPKYLAHPTVAQGNLAVELQTIIAH